MNIGTRSNDEVESTQVGAPVRGGEQPLPPLVPHVTVEVGSEDAAYRLRDALPPDEQDCILCFVPPHEETSGWPGDISRIFPDTRLLGATCCEDVEETGPSGGEILACGLPRRHFRSRVVALTMGETQSTATLTRKLLAARKSLFREVPSWSHEFAILLLNTEALREEATTSRISSALGTTLIVGGGFCTSAISGRQAVFTGTTKEDCVAVLVQVRSDCQVADFRVDNFAPGEHRLIVTQVDPTGRIVRALNGAPAAAEYERLLGIRPIGMSPAQFAEHPLVIRTGEDHAVQTILRATEEGGLEFHSRLETGTVLRSTNSRDMVFTLNEAMTELGDPVDPAVILAFDSSHWKRSKVGSDAPRNDVFRRRNMIRVITRGEVQGSLYRSNTLAGLAIYPPDTAEGRPDGKS